MHDRAACSQDKRNVVGVKFGESGIVAQHLAPNIIDSHSTPTRLPYERYEKKWMPINGGGSNSAPRVHKLSGVLQILSTFAGQRF